MTNMPDVAIDGGGGGTRTPKAFDHQDVVDRTLPAFGDKAGKGMFISGGEILGTGSNAALRSGHPEFGEDEFGDMTNDAAAAIRDLADNKHDDNHNGELDYAEISRVVDEKFASPELNAETAVNDALPEEEGVRDKTTAEIEALNFLKGEIFAEYGGERPK